MADASQVSMTAESPVKDVKIKKRPAKKKASAAAAVIGVDAETTAALELKAATQQEPSHSSTKEGDASAAPSHRRRQHYKKPSAIVDTVAGEPEARGTASASASKKRTSAKKEAAIVAVEEEDVSKTKHKAKKFSKRDLKPTWPFLRLSEPLGKSSRLPPVFSHDGRYIDFSLNTQSRRRKLTYSLFSITDSASSLLQILLRSIWSPVHSFSRRLIYPHILVQTITPVDGTTFIGRTIRSLLSSSVQAILFKSLQQVSMALFEYGIS
jgi:hypothetical protein